jgi:hypothetical protein
MKLTRRVLALTNRHSSTTRFSRRLTDIRKRRSALYKLCKELRRSNSSDSGHSLSDGPGSSGTNSTGPNNIYDPRHWRSSDTADSSPISSPQPEDRYTPTPLHLLPPPAHPPSDLTGLASRFRDTLFPPPRAGAARPQSPLGRGSPARPPPPTDRTLRSQDRLPPDGRRPDLPPRDGRR